MDEEPNVDVENVNEEENVDEDQGKGTTENEEKPQQKEEKKDKNEKDKKKRNSKAEAKRQKKMEELKEKRELSGIPWGSDPCVTMRVMLGKHAAGKLTDIKGSQFPWYVPPRKYEDIKKEEEDLYEMERGKIAQGNIQRFKESNKRFLTELYLMSKKVQKQRKWEANQPIESEMTYKEYIAQMEIRKYRMELKRQERANVRKLEANVERKLRQQEEGTKKKGKKHISKLKLFPKWYPMTVIPEFIYTLKMIEKQQEQPCKKKMGARKKTRKDDLLQEFFAFLEELRTITENMNRYEKTVIEEESIKITSVEYEIEDTVDEHEESVNEETDEDEHFSDTDTEVY